MVARHVHAGSGGYAKRDRKFYPDESAYGDLDSERSASEGAGKASRDNGTPEGTDISDLVRECYIRAGEAGVQDPTHYSLRQLTWLATGRWHHTAQITARLANFGKGRDDELITARDMHPYWHKSKREKLQSAYAKELVKIAKLPRDERKAARKELAEELQRELAKL